jgi:hypothetical protein
MKKSELSIPRQSLVRMMQRINFGRIISLSIRSGEPDFSRPYRTVRTVKLAGRDNGARPESGLADFELCKEQIALIDQISSLPDGTRMTIEVKHGVPFLVEIEQDHQAA